MSHVDAIDTLIDLGHNVSQDNIDAVEFGERSDYACVNDEGFTDLESGFRIENN